MGADWGGLTPAQHSKRENPPGTACFSEAQPDARSVNRPSLTCQEQIRGYILYVKGAGTPASPSGAQHPLPPHPIELVLYGVLEDLRVQAWSIHLAVKAECEVKATRSRRINGALFFPEYLWMKGQLMT